MVARRNLALAVISEMSRRTSDRALSQLAGEERSTMERHVL